MDVLYGLHPVEELLRSGGRGIAQVVVARERRDAKLDAIVALCREMRVPVSTDAKDALTRLAKTDQHQGVLATVRERTFLAIEDLFPKSSDEIQDQPPGAVPERGSKGLT